MFSPLSGSLRRSPTLPLLRLSELGSRKASIFLAGLPTPGTTLLSDQVRLRVMYGEVCKGVFAVFDCFCFGFPPWFLACSIQYVYYAVAEFTSFTAKRSAYSQFVDPFVGIWPMLQYSPDELLSLRRYDVTPCDSITRHLAFLIFA